MKTTLLFTLICVAILSACGDKVKEAKTTYDNLTHVAEASENMEKSMEAMNVKRASNAAIPCRYITKNYKSTCPPTWPDIPEKANQPALP